MSKRTYTHRYTVYAAQHGKTPDEMLAHDKKRWPGGKMCGFMLWINKRWQEWHEAKGYRRHDYIVTSADHVDFDAWIVQRAAERAIEKGAKA